MSPGPLAAPHASIDGTLQCLQCHGKVDDLAPEVRDVLAKNYPQDRATGFAAGDLRGWFWVEVPAKL